MFCGLCVEACPYDALHMGSGYEEGQYQRRDLLITIDQLREAPKRPSTWFRPQLESKGYDPFDGKEATWKDVGRHEQPSMDELEKRWARPGACRSSRSTPSGPTRTPKSPKR